MASVFGQASSPMTKRLIASDSQSAKRNSVSSGGKLDLGAAIQSLGEVQTWKSSSSSSAKHEQLRDHYNRIISLCIANKSISEGNHLRSHMARHGFRPGVFLDNQFINLYSKCGEVDMARDLFDRMPEKNVVSWNALISGYCSNSCFSDAIWLFHTMIQTCTYPNYVTYLSVLQAVVAMRDFELGKQIHSQLIRLSLFSHVKIGNALISMYSEYGRPDDGETVYRRMQNRDEASWNSLIALYAKAKSSTQAQGLFLEMLEEEGVTPNEFTFGSMLTLRNTSITEELHGQIIKMGLRVVDVFIGSALIDAYARSGDPMAACLVFDYMEVRNGVAWNSVISACLENNMFKEGLELFCQMSKEGVIPDKCTISILLKAAAALAAESSVKIGEQLHGLAIKNGLYADTLVGNSLIVMYSRKGGTAESWRVFNSIAEVDLVSWNSVIQSYVENEKHEQAIDFFVKMKLAGFEPNEFSFLPALAACASLARHRNGREVHCDLIKRGVMSDTFLGSALIDMYAKTALICEARKVFNGSHGKDLIIWNSMIAGLSQNGYLDDVFKLLSRMREERIEPDHFTFASAFAVCADSMAVHQGRQLHALILKLDVERDTALGNSLITMYSTAGEINEAVKVFSELPMKNVVTWTSMISGYVQGGNPRKAIETFQQLEKHGATPSDKTFIAVLTACSYAGLSEEAATYFTSMETRHGIRPGIDHYACMVDILGRRGRLEAAECLIESMPFEPNALVWRMLLSACRIQGDAERGERAMNKILELEPGDSAAYVLLSNLYASLGDWAGVVEIRQLMRDNGVRKEPGKSWIELNHRVDEFLAADCSHPQKDEIYSSLEGLLKQMKDEGYIPGIHFTRSMECCTDTGVRLSTEETLYTHIISDQEKMFVSKIKVENARNK